MSRSPRQFHSFTAGWFRTPYDRQGFAGPAVETRMFEDHPTGENSITGLKRLWIPREGSINPDLLYDVIDAQINELISDFGDTDNHSVFDSGLPSGEGKLALHISSPSLRTDWRDPASPITIDLEELLLRVLADTREAREVITLWESLVEKMSNRLKEIRAESPDG